MLRSSPVRFLRQTKIEHFVHSFVPSYKSYNGKDRLTIIDFENHQNYTGVMRQVNDEAASRCSLQDLLPANSSDNTHSGLSISGITASSFSELNYDEAPIRKVQYFWRKHSARVRDTRKFHQTPQGRIINSYLDLVARCIPKGLLSSAILLIRTLFTTEGVELQVMLDMITQKLHLLRKIFSDLFEDSELPPTRLEALQDPWNALKHQESTVAHRRVLWSTDRLCEEEWWFDPTVLERALARDLEELRSIEEQLNTLEAEQRTDAGR